MERCDFATMKPGTNLWVEATGERVTFKYLTTPGPYCVCKGVDTHFDVTDLLEAPLVNKRKSRTRARFERRVAVEPTASAAQTAALSLLASGEECEVWYHDLGARTVDALLARGWVQEIGRVRCLIAGHTHPGVIGITDDGRRAALIGDWVQSEVA
jgi:hypothetical protein